MLLETEPCSSLEITRLSEPVAAGLAMSLHVVEEVSTAKDAGWKRPSISTRDQLFLDSCNPSGRQNFKFLPPQLLSHNQNLELAVLGSGEKKLMCFVIERHGLCPGHGLDSFHNGILVRRVLMDHGDRAFTV